MRLLSGENEYKGPPPTPTVGVDRKEVELRSHGVMKTVSTLAQNSRSQNEDGEGEARPPRGLIDV